jgi:hypothetical protein
MESEHPLAREGETMPRASRRRPADSADSAAEAAEVSAGRRSLAAIDPAVMRRVVGRPEQRRAYAEDEARVVTVPAHRRPY